MFLPEFQIAENEPIFYKGKTGKIGLHFAQLYWKSDLKQIYLQVAQAHK